MNKRGWRRRAKEILDSKQKVAKSEANLKEAKFTMALKTEECSNLEADLDNHKAKLREKWKGKTREQIRDIIARNTPSIEKQISDFIAEGYAEEMVKDVFREKSREQQIDSLVEELFNHTNEFKP